MADLAKLAQIVDTAAREATAIPQLSEKHDFTLEDAYAIQQISLSRRYGRGERQSGIKMGFTSRAKMVQMGLDEMIWGRLTDRMLVEDGGRISLSDYVHPRVEPEVAFLLKRPLRGKVSPMAAMAVVEAVAPALEIIDSRYKNFKFSLPDVVADNSSSSGYVIGGWRRPDSDIGNLGIVLEFNGRAVQVGSSASILGHPARSLAAASRLAGHNDFELKAGWVVMAGGATAAEALRPGVSVRCCIENLGAAGFTVD